MLFELITNELLDARELYNRTHISAVQKDNQTYYLSDEEAEARRNAQQLEKFIIDTLKDLKISYISLKLVNVRRMVELQPQDA